MHIHPDPPARDASVTKHGHVAPQSRRAVAWVARVREASRRRRSRSPPGRNANGAPSDAATRHTTGGERPGRTRPVAALSTQLILFYATADTDHALLESAHFVSLTKHATIPGRSQHAAPDCNRMHVCTVRTSRSQTSSFASSAGSASSLGGAVSGAFSGSVVAGVAEAAEAVAAGIGLAAAAPGWAAAAGVGFAGVGFVASAAGVGFAAGAFSSFVAVFLSAGGNAFRQGPRVPNHGLNFSLQPLEQPNLRQENVHPGSERGSVAATPTLKHATIRRRRATTIDGLRKRRSVACLARCSLTRQRDHSRQVLHDTS